MTARIFTTADKPTAPLPRRIPTDPESLAAIDTIVAESIRLKADLQRLRALARVVLAEYDRGPGQTGFWPQLDDTVGMLREELKNPQ